MSETLYMVRFLVNGLLAKKDRFSALMTGASIPVFLLLIRRVFHLLRRYKELKVSIMGAVLAVVRRIPSVRARIAEEKLKAKESISRSILVNTGESHERLREKGVAVQQLIGTLEAMSKSEKRKWSGGNLTGAVYSTNAELDEVHAYALSHFGKTNLLHPDIFSCTRQMEAEVIRMTLDLFSGDAGCCGSVTMGGTESILLAVKSYRDRGRKERGITQSNIVIPSTAHAAFMKAGDYFGVEVRRASCDQSRDYEVDLASMASLIDSNTVAVVGSSPQYPHGTMDPIPAIAALALEHGIGCHVDACLGSYLLPFLRDSLPFAFDFSLEGVTSISCDTHKYAYAPKGSSVVMYRSTDLRQYQYSICLDWEGGLYATPTMLGSRCSSAVVAAWASLMYMGKSGYRDCAARISAGAKLIARTVTEELGKELVLLGRPDTSVVSFTARELNIFDIAEYMKTQTKWKWSLASLQNPAGMHFAVTMANVEKCAEFSEDLISAVHAERARIDEGGKIGSSEAAVIYGSTASVPKQLVTELVVDYLDTCYVCHGGNVVVASGEDIA